MKTLSELVEFEGKCKEFGIEIPDNLIIVSPEIIKEATEWIGKDKNVFKYGTGIKIYGINVIRDFAEVVEIH